MYTKQFVCLANSRKTTGRCIAGKELNFNGTLGPWLRPVSARPTQELHDRERQLRGRGEPALLDVLEVALTEARPHAHQSENHLVNERQRWTRRGLFPWFRLRNAVDEIESLWGVGLSSRNGLNDRVSARDAQRYRHSLLLIAPQDLRVAVAAEKTEFGQRHRARAVFGFEGQEYRFSLTDPVAEQRYLAHGDGEHSVTDALICVSLGEPWVDGYCYKYCAGLLLPPGHA